MLAQRPDQARQPARAGERLRRSEVRHVARESGVGPRAGDGDEVAAGRYRNLGSPQRSADELPGLIAATIFAFTVSWAQFLYPLVFTTSTDQLVMPVGIITTLIKGDVFNWGQIMTGALLGAAPPLIIYAFLMDYYIAGLTAGATKG